MTAFPVTFGHRRILPPGPGHRANHRAGYGPGPDQSKPALVPDQSSPIFWETFAISRTGGDIQATTKVVDCRSLKSSPPCFSKCVILERVTSASLAFEARTRVRDRAISRPRVLHGPPTTDVDGVILWRQRELSSMRRPASATCRFCGGKRPIDKKLFFGPNVRSLSRWRWSKTAWPQSRYGVPNGQARTAHGTRVRACFHATIRTSRMMRTVR